MRVKKETLVILFFAVLFLHVACNANCNITQSYNYDAFGNALNFDPATAEAKLLYSGEQYEPHIKHYYLRSRYYDPAIGRFNRPDPFAGNIRDPMSLHKYAYAHNDPINRVDPSGMTSTYTTHETLTVQGIQQNLIATVIGSVGITGMVYMQVKELDRALIEREIRLFVQTHTAPGTFTQAEFERLENLIRTKTRGKGPKNLYLHYSYKSEKPSLLSGLLPNSYATRTFYPTGWTAKWRLALPGQFHQGRPPDSVYIICPKKGFTPTGPTKVVPNWDFATPRRLMEGGGWQYIFVQGSGGRGSVFGPMPIPIGEYGDWVNFME